MNFRRHGVNLSQIREFGEVGGERTGSYATMGLSLSIRESAVAERAYGITEMVGTSKENVDSAIRNAVLRASSGTRHCDWFEVTNIRGYVRDGAVDHFQVSVKIGYRLEDA